jgi:hypothetical protein
MLEIIVDKKAMTVSVGDYVFKDPHVVRIRENNFLLKKTILAKSNIVIPEELTRYVMPEPPITVALTDNAIHLNRDESEYEKAVKKRMGDLEKAKHQFFAEHLGTRFYRRLNGTMYNLWVKDRFPKEAVMSLREGGRHWQNFDPLRVKFAHRMEHKINRVNDLGLQNLLPVMILLEEFSTRKLTRILGETSMRLARESSTSRNLRIARIIKPSPHLRGFINMPQGKKDMFWRVKTGNANDLYGISGPSHQSGFIATNDMIEHAFELAQKHNRLGTFQPAVMALGLLKHSTDVDIFKIRSIPDLYRIYYNEYHLYENFRSLSNNQPSPYGRLAHPSYLRRRLSNRLAEILEAPESWNLQDHHDLLPEKTRILL